MPEQQVPEQRVEDKIWYPPGRSTVTGHRISIGNYKPIRTSKLGWRWWLAEIPMRILARSMVSNSLTPEQVTGEEYLPD